MSSLILEQELGAPIQMPSVWPGSACGFHGEESSHCRSWVAAAFAAAQRSTMATCLPADPYIFLSISCSYLICLFLLCCRSTMAVVILSRNLRWIWFSIGSAALRCPPTLVQVVCSFPFFVFNLSYFFFVQLLLTCCAAGSVAAQESLVGGECKIHFFPHRVVMRRSVSFFHIL